MVAVGEHIVTSWFLSSGVAGFFVILVLSIFLTALCSCSDCRGSFQLKESEVEKKDSALISVVKLEETRENPMMSQIQNTEKDPGKKKENPVHIVPWRSHLNDHPCSDIFSFSSPAPNEYAYAGRRGYINSGMDASSPPTIELDINDPDRNSVFAAYARASLRNAPPPPPIPPPAEVIEGVVYEVTSDTGR